MPDAATATRSPVDLAHELFSELLNRRDADALVPYWAEDVVEVFPTGTLTGRRDLRGHTGLPHRGRAHRGRRHHCVHQVASYRHLLGLCLDGL
jgi:SnoaL-like domain